MIERWPEGIARVFDEGAFCHVAVASRFGPHLTPTVFAPSGERLWLTTARGSVKARVWRRDPTVAGMVRAGDDAVSFTGVVRLHDALDPSTWEASLRSAPAVARAAVRFTKKNARFYAGYAVDARHVPLEWTPPGRVFAELSVLRAALLNGGEIAGTWGRWPRGAGSGERFRASRRGDPLAVLPADVRERLGASGPGALAVEGSAGGFVLPARWWAGPSGLFAAMPASVLALGSWDEPGGRAALTLEKPSWWRASRMVGAMAQGEGEAFALEGLSSGVRSATAIVREAGERAEASALVRIRPSRFVWWRGWSSGAVRL